MKKPASGAARRRQKRQAEDDEADLSVERSAEYDAEQLQRYKAIGPPPSDVVGRVEWAQRMLLQALWDTACDEATTPRERRRVIGDLGAKVGLTAVKALYEGRLKKVEAAIYGRRDGKGSGDAVDDGLEALEPDA